MLTKERELDLVTCGHEQRARSRMPPRFLFGGLRGRGAAVGEGGQGGRGGREQPLSPSQFNRRSKERAMSRAKKRTAECKDIGGPGLNIWKSPK